MEENQVHPVAVPPAPLSSGNDPGRLPEVEGLGWNWGGFLLPYFWLIGHGHVSAGFLLMASAGVPFISFFHVIIYPMTAIYLGLNGYETAWKNQPYHSVTQLREKEREWVIWGLLINVLIFLGILFGLLYMRAFFTGVFREVEELGW